MGGDMEGFPGEALQAERIFLPCQSSVVWSVMGIVSVVQYGARTSAERDFPSNPKFPGAGHSP